MSKPAPDSRLTPDVLAATLSKAFGSTVHPDMITLDIRKGAPANPDGTINLMHYVAWLIAHENNARN
jgi:hypothetical protein